MTYGKDIKLSFQLLRVSCKHSFILILQLGNKLLSDELLSG